jgi:hypothetical protein
MDERRNAEAARAGYAVEDACEVAVRGRSTELESLTRTRNAPQD